MEIPKEYERLRERLVGDWSFRITRQMPDGFSLAGKGIMQVRELPGGYALETLYRSSFTGREPYEEYELWGYDRGSGTIRVYCANSRYAVLEFSGEWKDNATMTLHGGGGRGRKTDPAAFHLYVEVSR
jgi:hypothetical protein